jgi:hypothetical protein
MGEMINTCNILVGKPERKRQLGRHRSRMIILEWILGEYGWKFWTGCT